ncbi:MAG TPA: winged helix-turn-helix domain-containing protein [Pyrinomonadaceae bacterium]|nr:winged helix-turn-helix domain-containing protein [Pyrinomonadaceae bacterium]
MSQQARRLYEFGPFRIDTANRLLLRDGEPVQLTPKVVDTLLLLLENSGRVLGKEEILKALWPDSFVEEGNLSQNIYVLRKALNGGAEGESYIETIPRRGYRFAGQVRELPLEEGAGLPEPPGEILPADRDGLKAAQQHVDEKPESSPVIPQDSSRAGKAWPSRRWVLISSILLLGLSAAVGYYLLSGRAKRPVASAEIKSLAILPFKPLSAEAAHEYMGQGMADALITKLSNSRQISVRPTSVVLRYSAPGEDPLAAGRELGVEAVLDGKVQRSGDRVRVTVQLLRVSDGASLWAEQYDEKFTDILAVQDSISAQAARSLTLQLTGSESASMRKRYTENAEAYEAYLQGRYFWNKRSTAGFRKGIEYFQRAIEVDPNYALAYAGLADCYIRLNEYGVPMAQEAVPRGRAAVMTALKIDDALAEAHATLAFIKFRHDWDFAGADQEFKRSLQLDDNYSEAHQWYAFYLLAVGRSGEADAEMKRAQALDPLSLSFNSNLALYLFFKHEFDQSVQQSRKTLDMEPNYAVARVILGLGYEEQGLGKEAVDELTKAQELSPNDAATNAALGHALAKVGRAQDARRLLLDLEERAKKGYVPPYSIAVLEAGLNDEARALEWLERAFHDRSLRPVWLKFDPRLDGLRRSGKLTDLVRRVGLTP